MNWIFYLGRWYQVTQVYEGREYRLTIPGERTFLIMSRAGLEKALRSYYGLRQKHHGQAPPV
ncbi:hypothetical protein [Superficieibacter sp.]|uniref:hypothetical protein n=1 Tax=Superficieibacter sp. TaxID=2303322 RepID=UPI0028A90B47|nr:hypothetical protein [Superficieibacter sp.]